MKGLTRLLFAVLPVTTLVAVAAPAEAAPNACSSITAPAIPGARVTGVTGVERHDHTVPPGPFNPEPISGLPSFCEVVVTLTHPGADDHVSVKVWLPLAGWNGRFQGTGGGGFAAGMLDLGLVQPVVTGYAAAATDAGVPVDPGDPSSWALAENGDELLTNFAHRSLHDMTVVGKAVTAAFYGQPAHHSYWNGCSTGGRQGLMEAQRYPHDYDGIVATAPAVHWSKFIVADQWPQIVMQEEDNFPTQCELEAFNTAAVAACDRVDKVADGVIGDPQLCRYDPRKLIGTKIWCEGRELTISRADATVVARIWAGPGLWQGLQEGTPFSGIAGTVTGEDGVTTGAPFQISDNWIKYFVTKDPSYDTSAMDRHDFRGVFARSHAEYGRLLDTANPDLRAFRNAGGKMITWHGLADQLIFPGGTTDYRNQVARVTGRVDDFYRVFLAPGVDHCWGGPGPIPMDPLAAVVAWVEEGKAPDTLPATTADGSATRALCRYPLVSRYDGTGDPAKATSYRCARSY